MKIIIEKEQIIEGLQKAASILPQKSGAVYLRSIWIKAFGSNVSFLATDANIEFQATYPAQVEKEGIVGVQGRFFVELMRQLPTGKISLFLDENSSMLHIEQGRKKYKIPINDVEWFQEFSVFPEDNCIIWSGDFLLDILDKVSFCINDDETTDALSCLNIKPIPKENPEENCIEACGLNGHQFAMYSFVNEDLFNLLPESGILIQKKYVAELKKWLISDEIEFNITDKRIYLRTLKGEFLSLPRVVYDYPDYLTFLNDALQSVNSLKINRKECADALGRLIIFNTKNMTYTNFALDNDEAILSVQGQEIGSAVENLSIQYTGNVKNVAFPTKNLFDILNHFLSLELQLRLSDDNGPCVIQGDEDKDYLIILMPIQISTVNYYEDEDIV